MCELASTLILFCSRNAVLLYRVIKNLCALDDYNPHITDNFKTAITEYIRNVDGAIPNMVFENTLWSVNK
jgi:hypothetical protein